MTKLAQQATAAVRQGIATDSQYGAVVPPLYLSTNYTFVDHLTPREFDYSRSGNPTRSVLANTLAKLEQGAAAIITNTGLAAITLVLQLLSKDQLLVVPHDCYGGSLRLFKHLADKGHFQLLVVDQTDAQAMAAACELLPALIWLETPSNPLLRVVDISQVCQQARQCGAKVVVDNTFLSPALQQPLALGADIVVHSTTKYINGHSDVVGGAVIAANQTLADELEWLANTLGLTGGAFDAYLTLRGLRTLPLRMAQHQQNAAAITNVLINSPKVAKVYYPGLASHPGHEIAARQQRGFGGMLSFELVGGAEAVSQFLAALTLFSLAESLGGVESLVAVPASMTHRAMSAQALQAAGISDGLIRLSVGIEEGEDLLADINNALDAVGRQ